MRSFRLVAVSLLFAAITGHVSASRGRFQIDESKTRVRFQSGEPRVDLAIENRQGQAQRLRIKLEIVDPEDTIHAFGSSGRDYSGGLDYRDRAAETDPDIPQLQ